MDGNATVVQRSDRRSSVSEARRWISAGMLLCFLSLTIALAQAMTFVAPAGVPSSSELGKPMGVVVFAVGLVVTASAGAFAWRDVGRWVLGLFVAVVCLVAVTTVTFGIGEADSRSLPSIGLGAAGIVAWGAAGSAVRRVRT